MKDLTVPSFNGSSYLRYPGLADTSLSWLELAVTLKPTAADGVILYNGHHSDATGDFVALYLSSGHVQFTFDLGTGPASLRENTDVQQDFSTLETSEAQLYLSHFHKRELCQSHISTYENT
ncbi:hypothetical protein E2986_10951 [Frieseomelitta varia]|uniref:Laminin G domain-containing protein n=1 Tax=Frieseomelitta varia TaxID=561572 RepID=A0A833RFH7_9HYME|nr:hypothetical protein E2986_10951 [Frieseomelitta varia]